MFVQRIGKVRRVKLRDIVGPGVSSWFEVYGQGGKQPSSNSTKSMPAQSDNRISPFKTLRDEKLKNDRSASHLNARIDLLANSSPRAETVGSPASTPVRPPGTPHHKPNISLDFSLEPETSRYVN